MNQIISIASAISTPLGLAGFLAAAFFLLVRQVVNKKIFPKLAPQHASSLLIIIINRLFWLSLVAMVLGFIGFVIVKFHIGQPPDPIKVVLDFQNEDTDSAPNKAVSADPILSHYGISVRNLTPGSRVVLVNNLGLYGSKAVHPTTSQNLLTQIETNNKPASYMLEFARSVISVSFVRPALFSDSENGITFPEWSAHALDAQGYELSSQREKMISSYGTVPAQEYLLKSNGTERIAAVRFDSDPRVNLIPFTAFSTLLIERLTLTR